MCGCESDRESRSGRMRRKRKGEKEGVGARTKDNVGEGERIKETEAVGLCEHVCVRALSI